MALFPSSQSPLVKAVTGLLAGAVATGPMTVAMIFLHRRLPRRERYPLPPRGVVEKMTQAFGARQELDESTKSALTMVAHFGYGSAMGLLYAFLTGEVRAAAVLKGILFGLLVWAGSYLGLLPVVGILKPATERPARRNLLLIGVHIVWGAMLGRLVELYSEEFQPVAGRHAFASRTAPVKVHS